MDFSLGPAETQWRDRVRAFIDRARPAAQSPTMTRSSARASRWKVLPVVEELKAKARAEGLWNLFMPPSHGATPVDDSFEFEGPGLTNLQYAFCAEEMGRIAVVLGSVQLLRARHRQHGGDQPLRHARAERRVAEAADGWRDPLGVPDDRARRRLVRRDQHQVQHRDARQRICRSTAANGGRAAPATRAARWRS